MANGIQKNIIVRERGQLTIPKKMREYLGWIKKNAVITISVPDEKTLLITPPDNTADQKKEVDWDKIWKNIELVRSFKGKRGNLSRFVIKDRKNH